MTKYIIVKYADGYSATRKFTLDDSVYGTPTAIQCGYRQECYATRAELEPILKIMQDVNPGVGYDIVPVEIAE